MADAPKIVVNGMPSRLSCDMLSDAESTASPEIANLAQLFPSVCKIIQDNGSTASGFLCEVPCKTGKITGLMTNNHIISNEKLLLSENDPERDNISFAMCFQTSPCKGEIEVNHRDHVLRWFASKSLDASFLELNETIVASLAKKGIEPLELSTSKPSDQLAVAIIQYNPQNGLPVITLSNVVAIQGPDFRHRVSTDATSAGTPIIEMASGRVVGMHRERLAELDKDRYAWAINMITIVSSINAKFCFSNSARKRFSSSYHNIMTCSTASLILQRDFGKELGEAAEAGDAKKVKWLLAQGVDVNSHAYRCGNTPLMLAAEHGQLDVIRLLINEGADINAKNELGGTALIAATYYGQFSTVKLLLDRDADATIVKSDGNSALQLARILEHADIERLLTEK